MAVIDPAWIAVGGLVVAALGVVVQPAAAVFTAELNNTHASAMAREERRQRRLEDAYRGVINYLPKDPRYRLSHRPDSEHGR